MGSSDSIYEKEGLNPSTVHSLLTVEHGYDQESISIIED